MLKRALKSALFFLLKRYTKVYEKMRDVWIFLI
ncbi:unknown protein [Simkania negevensis Z]|uniref:Uncharacterized protein n=1 Tax=Simkania negevensis (strain ATCC VR-1471 / DSM 27360 / Z) TaxID=331113 RepID=F8L4M0_SIMNZ|nr:unknown protein [Simkania negevensis Z]